MKTYTNKDLGIWESNHCFTNSVNNIVTECFCYNLNNYYQNNILSYGITLIDKPETYFIKLIQFNSPVLLLPILLISFVWLIPICCFLFTPVQDDVPLIGKHAIIPSEFRYRMFVHTKEGALNDILRHSYANCCSKLCELNRIFYDNNHICCSFCNRYFGTNVSFCNRVSLLLFSLLLLLLLVYILLIIYLTNILDIKYLFINKGIEFEWMCIISFIGYIIERLILQCYYKSLPNRLDFDKIDNIVDQQAELVTQLNHTKQMQSINLIKTRARTQSEFATNNANKFGYNEEKWQFEITSKELEIKKLIHNENLEKSLLLATDVSKWDVDDVSTWLFKLGLRRYIDEFEHNNIDGKRILKMKSNEIKNYIFKDDDFDYFHKQLRKLKICWRDRYVILRTQHNKAKKEYKQKIKEQRQKEREEQKKLKETQKQLTMEIEQANTSSKHLQQPSDSFHLKTTELPSQVSSFKSTITKLLSFRTTTNRARLCGCIYIGNNILYVCTYILKNIEHSVIIQ